MMTLTKSFVELNGVRLYAYHGVMEQERRVGAWYVLWMRVEYNISRAMETDHVGDTISYADLLQLAKAEMDIPSNLLEHVTGRIAQAVAKKYPEAESIDLRLVKENPPMGADCDGAGVELHLINNKSLDERKSFS